MNQQCNIEVQQTEFFVEVQQVEAVVGITPSYVELVIKGPGIQGPAGPTGPVGPAGASGATTLAALTDVDQASKVDGSVLVYNAGTAKFTADTTHTVVTLTDGGNF